MADHRLAQGQGRSVGRVFRRQRRDVGRRRRRGRGEQIVEHVLAAQHGRGACRVGSDRQDAALAEQPAAPAVRPKLDAAEVAALNVRDPVVLGEPLVDERVLGRQELEHAAAAAKHAVDEQLRLALERRAQRDVVVGKEKDVGVFHRDVAQEQPLRREVRDHGLGACVGQHALYLRAQHAGIAQRAVLGGRKQLVVGDAAPEKERHSRGELDVADGERAGFPGLALDAVEELRAHEQTLEREWIPVSKLPSARPIS